jgi:hypothetical protein
MTLLYQILKALANLLRPHPPRAPRSWVARKGECPFCGNVLFGTTHAYQRLDLLDTVAAESQYLCIDCDQEKVSELLSLLEDGR